MISFYGYNLQFKGRIVDLSQGSLIAHQLAQCVLGKQEDQKLYWKLSIPKVIKAIERMRYSSFMRGFVLMMVREAVDPNVSHSIIFNNRVETFGVGAMLRVVSQCTIRRWSYLKQVQQLSRRIPFARAWCIPLARAVFYKPLRMHMATFGDVDKYRKL